MSSRYDLNARQTRENVQQSSGVAHHRFIPRYAKSKAYFLKNLTFNSNNSAMRQFFHPAIKTTNTLNDRKKHLVCLYRPGSWTRRTHRRDPATARRGHFELLDFSPGPFRVSSDNLATPGSPRESILTPSLARTLDQHVGEPRG